MSSQDLDMTHAGRGVWLVKVPKYMAKQWEDCSSDSEVGRLKIVKAPGASKPTVTFTLDESLTKYDGQVIPKEHNFVLSSLVNQSLGVFSQNSGMNTDSIIPESEHLAFEGRVVQRAECRPSANHKYLNMKKELIKKQIQPLRTTKSLKGPVNAYKPISNHKYNIEYEEKKKAEGKKSRDERDKVQEMLFTAFEKHQYYNIRDLVRITRQPVTYLKEVLKDVCTYNLKNPHKNMWELKPEYRHYKEDEDDDDDNE